MLNFINLGITGLFAWSGMSAGALQPITVAPVPSTQVATTTFTAPTSPIIISSVRLTAYNAVAEQTDSDPGITASGAVSNPEVIVARSRDFADTMPFGTVIALEAPKDDVSCGFKQVEHFIGYRVVADTMHARKTRQIDVMFAETDTVRLRERTVNPAVAMGICTATVRIVGKINMKDIPDTQVELAMMVHGTLALK